LKFKKIEPKQRSSGFLLRPLPSCPGFLPGGRH
jgi:hypothetical protein